MRLIHKTTLFFLLAMIPILMGGAYFMYKFIDHELRHDADEELIFDKLHWVNYIASNPKISTSFALYTPEIIIYPTQKHALFLPVLKDTIILQKFENEYDPYRQLYQIVSIRKQNFFIVLRKSLIEKKDLIGHISRIMAYLLIGIFGVTLTISWFINRRIWSPFNQTLLQIRGLNLQHMEKFAFKANSIKEFNELNNALESMVGKIHYDYLTLKEFTEDAAHEMQTPLAVAQTKLEILLQDPQLKEGQLKMILQTSEALERLHKLNHSLLLLAKIENLQFVADKPLSIRSVIEKYLILFQEIIQDKGLEIRQSLEYNFLISMHPHLADTLISNLLGNAIKYNFKGGEIRITLDKKGLCIRNSSKDGEIESQRLFKRFKKSGIENTGQSNGLGLSIVKKISDTHGLLFSYEYKEGFQEFSLKTFVV